MLLNLLYNFIARAIEIGTAHAWLPILALSQVFSIAFSAQNRLTGDSAKSRSSLMHAGRSQTPKPPPIRHD
jgi:hypothetical protein